MRAARRNDRTGTHDKGRLTHRMVRYEGVL